MLRGLLCLLFLIVFSFSQTNPFGQSAFTPDISFLLDVSLVFRNVGDTENLEIPGLLHGHTGEHDHGDFNRERGFNLNYGELFLNAPVDPYFELFATIPFSEGGANIEEAYVITRGLPYSLQLKVGKFRSSFGRLNSQHPHLWEFAQQPLVYRVFLGEGLVEKGVQVNWLPPTPFYLVLGAELLQGENEQSFGVKGFSVGNLEVGDAPKPGLFVGFLKTSFDLGNLSVLTGVSYARGHTRWNYLEGNLERSFAGRTDLYDLELTAKYFISSYEYLALQGEYIYRSSRGNEYTYDGSTLTMSYTRKEQGGFYLQLVWRFARRWRAGVQYNLIDRNRVIENGVRLDLPQNLQAYYGMLEFSPTEFSRLRLQVGKNGAFYEGGRRRNIGEVVLQLTFAIGAHSAHPF